MRNGRHKLSSNVDDLYAKVNRKAVLEKRLQNGLMPSTSNGLRNLQQIQPSTVSFRSFTFFIGFFLQIKFQSTNFSTEPEESIYQLDESGSGSITSSGSCNPSYRYLTVRESLGVIRERIRRRNEESNYATTENNSPAKEHYYSTISNDYDSVRNEPASTSRENNQTSNRNSLLMSKYSHPYIAYQTLNIYKDYYYMDLDELKINTMSNGQTGQFRPPPAPTSPIPQLPSTSHSSSSQGKPAAVSLNHSCLLTANTFSVASANLSNTLNPQLPPIFPVTPRIIDNNSNLIGVKMACSISMTSRPIVISLANVLRKHESVPNIKCKY